MDESRTKEKHMTQEEQYQLRRSIVRDCPAERANCIKGYTPVGKTPVLEVEARRLKLNTLSAVSNRGLLHFTITKESVNADILIDFMKQLTKDTGRKVLMIPGNLKVHRAKR